MAAVRLTAFFAYSHSNDVSAVSPAFAFEHTPLLPGEDELARTRITYQRGRLMWPQRVSLLPLVPSSYFEWLVDQVVAHSRTVGLTNLDAIRRGIEAEIRGRLMIAAMKRQKHLASAAEVSETEPSSFVVINNAGGSSPLLTPANQNHVGLKLSEAFEAWQNYAPKRKQRQGKLADEWLLAVNRFMAMHGDVDMGEITAQKVRDWRDKLLEIPGRTKKWIKALPLEEQAVIAREQDLDTLSAATVNKALSAIRTITEHVIDKMSHVPLEDNAAKRAKFVETDDDEARRLPFDEEEMAAIFRDLSIDDATGISIETLFWIVLMAPFTGCRLEELGTLRPTNIRREQGILFIAIERDPAQARSEQDVTEKSVKSINAERDIPVHPLLLQAGFAELVERRRREGAVWLFPDLTPNKYGKRTPRVSRLFARHLEELGITDDEKVFHSFRHSVRRNLRGRAEEEIIDLICGHSDGKVGRRYGRGADMRPLSKVIQLIDFKGPNWNEVIGQGRQLGGLPLQPSCDGEAAQLTLAV
jgi:integrase